ncbi:MAG: YdcF family protein [Elusimicrobiota bacterium]|jgi:uncharacterized SAM-binding protein YcdF (DUF218 family)
MNFPAPFPKPLRRLLLGAAALVCAAAAGLAATAWWLDCSDEPRKADLIVLLAGAYSRPFHAADLYKHGLAPEVWVSRPYRAPAELKALALGTRIPAEEEVHRDILLRLGVPPARIRLYGDGVMSTVNEALALRRSLDLRGKTVLVVTSRWHARRARLVFRRALPGTKVLVCATPYEEFTRRWWTRQDLARSAVLEGTKMLYYLLGGRFISKLEDTPFVS